MAEKLRELEQGEKYPYGGQQPQDWAERAALGVLYDLNDRRGIKHALAEVDHSTRQEIVVALSGIIRAAAGTGRWIACKDRSPDRDGFLWAVLTERRHNGVVTGYIPLYEYYHFDNGWATDESLTHWLDCPLLPMPPLQT